MGVYWIRLRLDWYIASRRRTGLRKKVQFLHGKKACKQSPRPQEPPRCKA